VAERPEGYSRCGVGPDDGFWDFWPSGGSLPDGVRLYIGESDLTRDFGLERTQLWARETVRLLSALGTIGDGLTIETPTLRAVLHVSGIE